jgi:hypothetical protein
MKLNLKSIASLLAAALGTATASASDVQYYLSAKGLHLHQTNAGPAIVITNENPFRFVAEVLASDTNSVTNATLTLASKQVVTLPNLSGEDEAADFAFEQGFTNKTALDKAFKAGVYTFVIEALNDGSNRAALKLPKDLYPGTPHIANWDDAQAIESKLPFIVRWDAIANAGTNDLVLFDVAETNGSARLSTPGFFQPGALDGSQVTVEIPADALDPDQTYDAQLLVVKSAVRNTNSIPGTTGLGGYFRQVKFPLTTLPLPVSGGRVQFSASGYSATENDGGALITVTYVGDEENPVSVNLATSDGTAADGTNYLGVSTTLTLDSDLPSTNIFIPIINDFTANGSKTVNLSLSSLTGNAVFGSRSNSVLTIVDSQNVAAGALQFLVTSVNVSEASPTALLTVTRIGGKTGAVTVNYHTEDGSAQAGLDYVATNGTLFFPDKKAAKITIPVQLLNDSTNEAAENFYLVLDATSGGAALGTNYYAVVNLLDNDAGGTVAVSSANYVTNENSGFFLVRVTRTGTSPLASGVTVDFATQIGTATAGLDYTPTNGTLTFGSNEMTKIISVPVLNDILAEGDENLQFQLSNPQGGATLGTVSNATLTIKDDENSVAIESTSYTTNEAAGVVSLRVIRSGVLTSAVSVGLSTANGTAVAGSDYVGTNLTLSFPANASSATAQIRILNDFIMENTEQFSVSLHSPAGGAQIGSVSNAVVNITDNDSAGTFKFSSATYSGSEGATVNVNVQRTGGAANGVTIQFNMSNGTAATGDYSNASQLLTFAGGETNKTIAVALTSDYTSEGAETVNLSLTSPSAGGTLGSPGTATLTINNVAPSGSPFSFKATTSPGGAFSAPLVPTYTDRLTGVFSLVVGNANNSLLAISALQAPTSLSQPTRTVVLTINNLPNNPVLPLVISLTDGDRTLIYQEQTTTLSFPPVSTVKQWRSSVAVPATATITEYDPVNKIVAGTYSGSGLPVDPEIDNNAATGTCNISSGSFRVKCD